VYRARQGRVRRRVRPGTGRTAKDPEITELEREVERTSKALKELAIENTLVRGKVDGA
jgi:hypothetical protein